MILEIINPSDYCTLEAPDIEIAAVALVLLGQGKYGLENEAKELAVPIFLFGGHDEWFQEKLGYNLDAILKRVCENRHAELAACLDSVVYGDRALLADALTKMSAEDAKAYRDKWQDAKRTSMNNIAGRGQQLAERVRKEYGNAQSKAE